MIIRKINILTMSSKNDDGTRKYGYLLEISEGPAWKIIRGRLYHIWDMRAYKWRIMKLIVGPLSEKLHRNSWHFGDKEENIPWDIRQDLRCFDWNNHEVIFKTSITEEEYIALGGKHSNNG